MDFYMYHGRLSESDGATDTEGQPIDGWGFEGPRLEKCIGFHCTYGAEGHFNVFFEDTAARNAAQELTGWPVWNDKALIAQFSSDYTLLKILEPKRFRLEYFGDWGIK